MIREVEILLASIFVLGIDIHVFGEKEINYVQLISLSRKQHRVLKVVVHNVRISTSLVDHVTDKHVVSLILPKFTSPFRCCILCDLATATCARIE